jgi:MFS transporter, DHA1 family, inner membrane transport protein
MSSMTMLNPSVPRDSGSTAPAATGDAPPTVSVRRLLLLGLGTFALGTESLVISGVLPEIGADLGVSTSAAGQLVTAFALTYALSAPFVGVLVSRFPTKRVLTVAMGLFAVANLGAAAAPSFATLMIARIVTAFFAAAYTPQASAMAATVSAPGERGRALAAVYGGLSSSTVIGVPLGTWIAGASSWRWTFVFVSALSVAAMVGVHLFLPSIPVGARRSWGQWLSVFRQRRVQVIVLVTLLAMVSQFTVFTYVAELVGATIDNGTGTITLMLLLFGVAGVTGNQLSGRLADAWGPSRTIRAAVALMGASFVLLAVLTQLDRSPVVTALTIAALLAWGVGGWGFLPAQQLRLVRVAPEAGPLVLSVNASSNYAGIALGGALGGLSLAIGSLTTVTLVGVGVAALAVSLVALGDR